MSAPSRRRRSGPATPRKPPAERREQLLQATKDLIQDEGLAMVTMEAVARRANVSKPVLYARFANRAALLSALLEDFWADVDQRLKLSVSPVDTLEEFTVALVGAYFDGLDTGGKALQDLLASGAEEPEIDAARHVRFRAIEALWSTKYQRVLGLSVERADIAAAILRSALAGAGEYWITRRGQDRNECILVCLAVMRGGMAEIQRFSERS